MEPEAAPEVRREGHESTRSSRHDREGSTDRSDPRVFRRIHGDAQWHRDGLAKRTHLACPGENCRPHAKNTSRAQDRADETGFALTRSCLQQATVTAANMRHMQPS